MSKAMLSNALTNGTKSWDVTISDCLSLVLQAGLASRGGDFKRSGDYGGNEHLRWEHIKMLALGDRADPKLKMVVTLHYRKGFK